MIMSYIAQKRKPVKNDWVLVVNADKSETNLHLTDDQISKISKFRYKKMIKQNK